MAIWQMGREKVTKCCGNCYNIGSLLLLVTLKNKKLHIFYSSSSEIEEIAISSLLFIMNRFLEIARLLTYFNIINNSAAKFQKSQKSNYSRDNGVTFHLENRFSIEIEFNTLPISWEFLDEPAWMSSVVKRRSEFVLITLKMLECIALLTSVWIWETRSRLGWWCIGPNTTYIVQKTSSAGYRTWNMHIREIVVITEFWNCQCWWTVIEELRL